MTLLQYFPKTVSAHVEKHEDDLENELAEKRLKEENFGDDLIGRYRTKLWDILEYPETSKAY